MYGHKLYIDNVPYHFDKYIPTEEEIRKFKAKNKGMLNFQKVSFFTVLYRLRNENFMVYFKKMEVLNEKLQ